MVGECGQRNAHYPSQALWEDIEYEYAGAVLFSEICRTGRFV